MSQVSIIQTAPTPPSTIIVDTNQGTGGGPPMGPPRDSFSKEHKKHKSTSDYALQGGKIWTIGNSIIGIPAVIALHKYLNTRTKRIHGPGVRIGKLNLVMNLLALPIGGFIWGYAAGGLVGMFKNRHKKAHKD